MNFLIKTAFTCSITAICLTGAYSQSISPSKDLPNLYKVGTGIYRGGQPTEAGIIQLKALGIRTVINLRDDDDRAKKEGDWARSAGLNFINIPLSNLLGPKDAKIDRILEQMTLSENQPVFIHCKRGSDRTGTAIAIYRISREGWSGDRANAEAKKFGFGWWQFWMKDYIDDFYRDFIESRPAK
jgi:protein tyrosine/serine phosphatase